MISTLATPLEKISSLLENVSAITISSRLSIYLSLIVDGNYPAMAIALSGGKVLIH